MAEEGAQVAVPEVGAAAETPTMFDAEGNFSENWTHLLTDTALHDNPALKASNTIESLASQTVNAQKLVGADKIAIPNEASTELEWETFHKAGGRPETATDYNFARPEALPEEYYSQERATAAQELMHKLGLSQKQADALFEFNNNAVIAQLTTAAQDSKLAMTGLQDALHADWGNAYEQKMHLGNKAIEEGTAGDADFKERLTQKFGNDPDFVRFAANIGGKFTEAGSVKVDLIPTPADMQTDIDNQIADPAYGTEYAKHGFTKQQHKAQVEKVAAMFREKAKHAKTG